jgi:hypothetical protein
MAWDRSLAYPIELRDGRVIRTLSDAQGLVVGLPARAQERSIWTYAAHLLLTAAHDDASAGDVFDATSQLKRALIGEGLIDV